MPETHKNAFVCFVHGHGTRYASDAEPAKAREVKDPAPVLPISIERVRLRAAAQLAFQRVALRTFDRE